MCKVIAIDPAGIEATRIYLIPEAQVPKCKRALAMAGYYVSVTY